MASVDSLVSGLLHLALESSPFAPRWPAVMSAARRAVPGFSPWPRRPAGGRRVFSSLFLSLSHAGMVPRGLPVRNGKGAPGLPVLNVGA